MFVELADIPLKDWKFLVEKGMMYGPSVVTPGCVRALSALQGEYGGTMGHNSSNPNLASQMIPKKWFLSGTLNVMLNCPEWMTTHHATPRSR